MSVWGSEADALIALVRGSTGTLPPIPAGAAGAERGVRPGSDLSTSEKPHLFVYSAAARISPLAWAQSEIRTTWEADLWIDGTQEQAMLYLDGIRTALAADRSLAGAVVDCTLIAAVVLEDPNAQNLRVVAMTFETFRWEG